MGGADQDIKFANSLSGEEGRRRGGGEKTAGKHQSIVQKSDARDPL